MSFETVKLNFKAIILGVLVSLCLVTFLDVLLVGIFGGLVAGLLIANRYLDGALNGALTGALSTGLYLTVIINFIYPTMFLTNPAETIILWFICIITGLFGGIAGTLIGKQMRTIVKSARTPERYDFHEWETYGSGNKDLSGDKNLGSLVCSECGGYYALKEGESPDDFHQCECGGKLKFKSAKDHNPVKWHHKPQKLNKRHILWRRIIAMEVGAVIIFISGLFIHSMFQPYLLAIVILAGFITSFAAGGKYQEGAFNSSMIGLIGAILIFLSYGYLEYIKISLTFTEIVGISLIIIYLVLAIIGGLIAILIRPLIMAKYYELRAGRDWKEILNSDSDKKAHILVRFVAILIGAFICLILNTLICFLAGFITSFLVKGSYKDGIIYSALAGFLGGIGFIIMVGYFGLIENSLLVVVGFIIDEIFVIMGGIFAIFLRKRLDYRKPEILICDKCNNYYEIPPGEFSLENDFVCKCGGNLNHSNRPSLLMVTIGYIIAILGGILGLIIGGYFYTRKNPAAKFHGKRMMIIAIIATVFWGVVNLILIYLKISYLHIY